MHLKQFIPREGIDYVGRTLLHYGAAFSLLFSSASAEVRMPAIFGDHMVLQQEENIPVWGWADAGEVVTVTLGLKSSVAVADQNGAWRVELERCPAEGAPLQMTIKGKNSLVFKDVLIGDVWLCSGQSNMERPLESAHNAISELQVANDSELRLFVVGHSSEVIPQADLKKGKWVVCTPESAAKFSGVAYFFGRSLRREFRHPIGLIASHWEGTSAQAWISLEGLEKAPAFQSHLDRYRKVEMLTNDPAQSHQLELDFKQASEEWKREVGIFYGPMIQQWREESRNARAAGLPVPPKPEPSRPKPRHFKEGKHLPTGLYNGMIAPLIPYSIKGVIWYQGEGNIDAPKEYGPLFRRLIEDWRGKWRRSELPFLFVQVANFGDRSILPKTEEWALLREAQASALSIPQTGMAIAIDLGEAADIHPKDHQTVGERLACVAKKIAYGQDIVATGPAFSSFRMEGNNVRISFTETGNGLVVGASASSSGELRGFALAGKDRKWRWARAKIDGSSVILSAPEIDNPVAVRYGFSNNPQLNLYNQDGLPAAPFRTDDWD